MANKVTGGITNPAAKPVGFFDFTIKYQTSKYSKATKALSLCAFNPDSSSTSNTDADKFEVISHSPLCVVVISYLKRAKMPHDLKLDELLTWCGL